MGGKVKEWKKPREGILDLGTSIPPGFHHHRQQELYLIEEPALPRMLEKYGRARSKIIDCHQPRTAL